MGTPEFNGYFKWYHMQHGKNPQYTAKGLHAPPEWTVPSDWTFFSETGHWYTPTEMQDAGYEKKGTKWVHPNETRKAEIEKENADIDARIARRTATEKRFRQVNATGRAKTILTGPNGVAGRIMTKTEELEQHEGLKK